MSPSKVITVVFIILMAGAALIWILFQNDTRISWGDTTRRKLLLYDGGVIQLYQGKKIEQTFTANYPGLSQIEILFGSADGQRINFYLRGSCAASENLVSQAAALLPIDTPTFHTFEFSPLDDSAGQTYCLVLESPQTLPQNQIKLPLSQGDLYPYGALKEYNPPSPSPDTSIAPDAVDNQNLPYQIFLPIVLNKPNAEIDYVEDIGFQLRYRGLIAPTSQVFMARLTANRPYLWGQSWFYVGLIVLYIGVLVGLFFVVWGTVRIKE